MHCHTVVRSSLQLSAKQCLLWRYLFGESSLWIRQLVAPGCCPSVLLQSEHEVCVTHIKISIQIFSWMMENLVWTLSHTFSGFLVANACRCDSHLLYRTVRVNLTLLCRHAASNVCFWPIGLMGRTIFYWVLFSRSPLNLWLKKANLMTISSNHIQWHGECTFFSWQLHV